jgi:hypothetical protein
MVSKMKLLRYILTLLSCFTGLCAEAQVRLSAAKPVEKNGEWMLDICMDNGDTKVTSLQFDLTVPSDYSYSSGNYVFTNRCGQMVDGKMKDTHTLISSSVNHGGTIRVLIYSNDNKVIQGSDGAFVTFGLEGLSTATQERVNITNIVVGTLDDKGMVSATSLYPRAYVADSSLACYDVMGTDILVIGELSVDDLSDVNLYLSTAQKIDKIDLSRCTNENLGELSLPDDCKAPFFMHHKEQVANKDSHLFYKRGNGWGMENLVINDTQESFDLEVDAFVENVSYSRNFRNTSWQPLFIPSDLDMDNVPSRTDIAEICGISEDDESIKIYCDYIVEGMLKANTPYLVRAKTKVKKNFKQTDVYCTRPVIKPKSFTTSYSTFTFTGSYVEKSDMYDIGAYGMSKGRLCLAESADVTLGAFRWFMEYKTKSHNANKRCELMFDGFVDGIDDVATDVPATSKIYDLTGRPVNAVNKKGIYIVNGKKVRY